MSGLQEHTERAERKREWGSYYYARTCEFIADIGIDPKSVSVDSITIHGYDSFDPNAEGTRILRDGELVRTRMEWPNPMVGGTVLALMLIDRKRGTR